MVVDHVNHIMFDRSFAIMTIVGRAVLPLFCYAVAIGLKRSRSATDDNKYLTRLTIWGLLCEPISQFTKNQTSTNILVTLGLGVIFARFSERLKQWQLYAFYLFAIATFCLPMPAPVEYGLVGIVLPAAFYHALTPQKGSAFFLFLLLMMLNNHHSTVPETHTYGIATHIVAQILIGFGVIIIPYAILQIARWLPQTGRLLPKYFLYVFYPAHLILIKAISYLF